MKRCEDVGPWAGRPRAQMMKSDEVEAILHLRELGWGLRRIAREFGCSKNTVKRYVAVDGWTAYSRRTGGGKLEDQAAWLKERFFQHRGNAEVVRQDLLRERSVDVSLRTVERAVAPFRRLLAAEAKATVAVRDAPGTSAADRFRPVAGADRGRAGARLPVRGDAGLLAALPCGGVPARAAVVLVSRPGGRVRSLRRRDEGGADRQPAAAGGRSRRVDARGRVQRPVPGVRGLLGVPPSGVCAVSSPDEGEGRAWSRLRQAKRHRWPSFRELGGAGGASGLVAAGRLPTGGATAPPVRFLSNASRGKRRACAPVRAGRRSASCGI